MRSLPASLLWRGALAVVVGVIAFAWPSITVGAFVILFAVYAFLAAVLEFGQAFASTRIGPVAGHIVLAVLDVGAGVIALAWPGITALVLVTVIAAWAFVIGVTEVGLAFRAGETAGERAFLGLTGLISIALGVALVTRPDIGAITIAQVYGLFSLVSGISSIVIGLNLRRAGQIAPLGRMALDRDAIFPERRSRATPSGDARRCPATISRPAIAARRPDHHLRGVDEVRLPTHHRFRRLDAGRREQPLANPHSDRFP